jgi:hypothetical protein
MASWNPYKLYLPVSFDVGELERGVNDFAKALSWELGEKISQSLTPALGAEWFHEFLQKKKAADPSGPWDKQNIHDPAFLFKELKNPGSFLWKSGALPPFHTDLKDCFFQAKDARNIWEHDALNENLDGFKEAIFKIFSLAEKIKMDVATYHAPLLQRFEDLKKSGGNLQASDEVQKYKSLLAAKDRELEDLAARQEKSAGELRKTAGNQEGLKEALQAAQEATVIAHAEREKLEGKLHAELQHQRLLVKDAADDYIVGQIWASEWIGSRTLKLHKAMNDLQDTVTGQLLGNELGPVAIAAAKRWLEVVPKNGIVNVTPSGHAAIFSGGHYVYLGRLDEVVNGFKPHAVTTQEFLDEKYLWSEDGLVRLDKEGVAAPEKLLRTLQELSDLQGLDEVQIRITTDGIIAGQINHQWIQLAKLPA